MTAFWEVPAQFITPCMCCLYRAEISHLSLVKPHNQTQTSFRLSFDLVSKPPQSCHLCGSTALQELQYTIGLWTAAGQTQRPHFSVILPLLHQMQHRLGFALRETGLTQDRHSSITVLLSFADDPVDCHLSAGLSPVARPNLFQQTNKGLYLADPVIAEQGFPWPTRLVRLCVLACNDV